MNVSAFAPVSLSDVLAEAPAMVRVDRKYLVPRPTAQRLLDRLVGRFRVLEVAGRRQTSYRSGYFDTPDLHTCRAHLQQRRRRWKVRYRLYLEDGLHRLEVKTRDGSGRTAKTVADRALDAAWVPGPVLGTVDCAFVEATLAAHGFTVDASNLSHSMEVSYSRTTLADLATAARVTVDVGVTCVLGDRHAWVDEGYVIVETKGGFRPGAPDRVLLDEGVRPRALSKYASTAALLRDDLADNDVRRLHGVQLHTSPVAMPPEPRGLGVAS